MPHPFQVKSQQVREQQQRLGGIPSEIKDLPDMLLIKTLVAHGQPEWSARELTSNPQLRFAAVQFFFDVEDASKGDKVAKQRVDFLREQWSKLRKEEIIADDPNRMYGDMIDPKELL